jgi:hypothetical protein
MDDLTLDEWTEELKYALGAGPGAWGMMSVVTYKTAAAGKKVIETARGAVAAGGLRIVELDARSVAADLGLLPFGSCYVILHDVELPLSGAVPVLVGGIQQLVTRGLMVGMLVTGSSAGIRALRRKDLGLVSLAEVLDV